jgi:hypothetical protein
MNMAEKCAAILVLVDYSNPIKMVVLPLKFNCD